MTTSPNDLRLAADDWQNDLSNLTEVRASLSELQTKFEETQEALITKESEFETCRTDLTHSQEQLQEVHNELQALALERDNLLKEVERLTEELGKEDGLRVPEGKDINDFLAQVPDGATVILDRNFVANSGVRLLNKKNITLLGEGPGPHITATSYTGPPRWETHKWPRTRAHLKIQGCTDITVDGLVIKGAHPFGGVEERAYVEYLEAQHGYTIESCRNVIVSNTQVTDVFGDFFYVAGSTNVELKNFNFVRNGRQGIASSSVNGLHIHHGKLDQVRRTAFDWEPNKPTNKVLNVHVHDVELVRARLNVVSAGGSGEVSNIRFENLFVSSYPMKVHVASPAGTRARKNWAFVNCRATQGAGNPHGYNLTFNEVDGLLVEGCHFPQQQKRNMYMAGLRNCTDYTFRNNTYPNGIGEVLLRK